MNQVLRPFLNKFVVVYFDDILIYSRIKTDHIHHLREVLEALRANQLFANPKKCSWMAPTLIFLGFIVSAQGISPDEDKVRAIQSWHVRPPLARFDPKLALAGFYRRFIQGYSTITSSITDLLKSKTFTWTNDAARIHLLDRTQIGGKQQSHGCIESSIQFDLGNEECSSRV